MIGGCDPDFQRSHLFIQNTHFTNRATGNSKYFFTMSRIKTAQNCFHTWLPLTGLPREIRGPGAEKQVGLPPDWLVSAYDCIGGYIVCKAHSAHIACSF